MKNLFDARLIERCLSWGKWWLFLVDITLLSPETKHASQVYSLMSTLSLKETPDVLSRHQEKQRDYSCNGQMLKWSEYIFLKASSNWFCLGRAIVVSSSISCPHFNTFHITWASVTSSALVLCHNPCSPTTIKSWFLNYMHVTWPLISWLFETWSGSLMGVWPFHTGRQNLLKNWQLNMNLLSVTLH